MPGEDSNGEGTSEGLSVRELVQQESETQQSSQTVFQQPELVDPETVVDDSRVVGRDEQVKTVISNLSESLNGNRPENMILFGPSGTGKSLILNIVSREFNEVCGQSGVRFGTISLNCQRIDTVNRAAYELLETTADQVGEEPGVAKSGTATAAKFERLYDLIDEYYDVVLFAIDEIDLLVQPYSNKEPPYSNLLYRLTRLGEERIVETKCAVAAITNKPSFMEDVDSRARSSFNPNNVEFPNYEYNQLEKILEARRDAFRDEALDEGVIPLCAAFGSQTHGDARLAIELLRDAGKRAERLGHSIVNEDHVRDAQEIVNEDRTKKLLEHLSNQKKLSIYAVAAGKFYTDVSEIHSKAAYNIYKFISEDVGMDEVNRQTFAKYLKEVEVYDLVTITKKSQGVSGGMHARYSVTQDPSDILTVLNRTTRFDTVAEHQLKEVCRSQVMQIQS